LLRSISVVKVGSMQSRFDFVFRSPMVGRVLLVAAFMSTLSPAGVHAEESAAAKAAFSAYVAGVEARLQREHASTGSILAPVDTARLHSGEFIVEDLASAHDKNMDGALLHDWRGTAFVPGAKAADFDRVMKDFAAFPKYFAPQILRTHVLSQNGDHYQISMRVRQKHIITVVMDMDYDTTFARVGAGGYSISRSTRVIEIDAPGTPQERPLPPNQDHGFLWEINNYWTYEERDGGLYIQVESVSLSRSLPPGIGWAIGPFIKSVPRESLEFTLHATSNALRR
jgi:hypothetical protein